MIQSGYHVYWDVHLEPLRVSYFLGLIHEISTTAEVFAAIFGPMETAVRESAEIFRQAFAGVFDALEVEV